MYGPVEVQICGHAEETKTSPVGPPGTPEEELYEVHEFARGEVERVMIEAARRARESRR